MNGMRAQRADQPIGFMTMRTIAEVTGTFNTILDVIVILVFLPHMDFVKLFCTFADSRYHCTSLDTEGTVRPTWMIYHPCLLSAVIKLCSELSGAKSRWLLWQHSVIEGGRTERRTSWRAIAIDVTCNETQSMHRCVN